MSTTTDRLVEVNPTRLICKTFPTQADNNLDETSCPCNRLSCASTLVCPA